jgi:hypothetical protein
MKRTTQIAFREISIRHMLVGQRLHYLSLTHSYFVLTRLVAPDFQN